jgi:hypothetical protein
MVKSRWALIPTMGPPSRTPTKRLRWMNLYVAVILRALIVMLNTQKLSTMERDAAIGIRISVKSI